MRVLLLPLADEWYAIELAALRGVVAAPDVFPVPTAPGWLLGTINVRGDVVPLVDTAALLGVGRIDEIGFAAIVDNRYGLVALAAEGLPETAQLERQVGASSMHGIVGSYTVGARVAALIDSDRVVVPAA